jgi:hypothetical protein
MANSTRRVYSHQITHETTPLLPDADHISESETENLIRDDINDDDEKSFPLVQILLLCFARAIEPMAFFAIFPFINQMILETNDVEESDVGFYSGLIVIDTILSFSSDLTMESLGITILPGANALYDTLGTRC